MNKSSKILLILLVIMVLAGMTLFLSGCDDGDGDDPPESFFKMLFSVFLASMFIFTATSGLKDVIPGNKKDKFFR